MLLIGSPLAVSSVTSDRLARNDKNSVGVVCQHGLNTVFLPVAYCNIAPNATYV